MRGVGAEAKVGKGGEAAETPRAGSGVGWRQYDGRAAWGAARYRGRDFVAARGSRARRWLCHRCRIGRWRSGVAGALSDVVHCRERDRKSTRLNSSHTVISYAVFCLKKKKKNRKMERSQCECVH